MESRQFSFAIHGMFCARCAVQIEQALTRLDGMIAAQVNYASERATVRYDPSRVELAALIAEVRRAGFDTPLQTTTFYVSELMYAASARLIESALKRVQGVVQVTANLSPGQLTVVTLAEVADPTTVHDALRALGLHVDAQAPSNPTFGFVVRTVVLGMLLSALIGAVLVPLVGDDGDERRLVALSVVVGGLTVLAGYPFYRRLWAALVARTLDESVRLRLLAFVPLVIALSWIGALNQRSFWAWIVWSALTAASALTVGWFVMRAWSLRSVARWRSMLPPLAGFVAALALIGLYLGILSVLQSPSHALEQFALDRFWVGSVALGFGVQIGLYVHLRLILHAMRLVGAAASSRRIIEGTPGVLPADAAHAMTGAGTGTSTVGMIACCAHHLADLAPLIGMTGASGLSGVVTFLGEWKIPLIVFGLLVNGVGIAVSLRTLQKQRAHLNAMERAAHESNSMSGITAPACH